MYKDLQAQIKALTVTLNAFEADLEAEQLARIAADNALEADLEAEQLARIAADNAEKAAREAEDLAIRVSHLAFPLKIVNRQTNFDSNSPPSSLPRPSSPSLIAASAGRFPVRGSQRGHVLLGWWRRPAPICPDPTNHFALRQFHGLLRCGSNQHFLHGHSRDRHPCNCVVGATDQQ